MCRCQEPPRLYKVSLLQDIHFYNRNSGSDNILLERYLLLAKCSQSSKDKGLLSVQHNKHYVLMKSRVDTEQPLLTAWRECLISLIGTVIMPADWHVVHQSCLVCWYCGSLGRRLLIFVKDKYLEQTDNDPSVVE
jgi:hypothetical protein